MSTTVILGGGLTGLASAFYLSRLSSSSRIVLLEASDRFGGWVRSSRTSSSSHNIEFETGPRSIRPVGLPGLLTLQLISELGLEGKLVTVDKKQPAARNRYIFYNGKLHRAPSSLASAVTASFSRDSPFSGLLPSVLREPFVPSPPLAGDVDESVDSFVTRRFGPGIARNVLSALVHGIYAGDTRQLSVRSVFPSLWNAERDAGSIVRSVLPRLGKRKTQAQPQWETDAKDQVEKQMPDLTQRMKRASVYSLKGGLEQLPKALVQNLSARSNVELLKQAPVQSLAYESGKFKVSAANHKEVIADRVVSALSSTALSRLLPSLPHLAYNPSVTVGVVNLAFPSSFSLPVTGFGYLIPRSVPLSQNPHRALGVVFDSDMFSALGRERHSDPVRLTVMMGGHYWRSGEVPSEEALLAGARETLALHGLVPAYVEPIAANVSVQRDCIPQYAVGHPGRMKELHAALEKEYGGKLGLVGSSYSGVGVNDCVKSAWAHARLVNDKGQSTGLEQWA